MSLNNKPLDSIDEGDLQSLIDNEVPEDKTLDYKQSLPGGTNDAKREFLADVSSFANASGGHLVFGMKEQEGVAVELCGLDDINADAEILRLENMIRDGIEPRISGISTRAIPLQASSVAIVMHIPGSWSQPHVVKVKGHWRFYSRNSAGKYPLDVAELRSAFALSETTAERIRNFRMERLSAIVAGETPVPLNDGAKIVLHIVPFGAFDPAVRIDVTSLSDDQLDLLTPIYTPRLEYIRRYNFDGFLTYAEFQDPPSTHSYLQIFRNGMIEAAEAVFLNNERDKSLLISPFERELLDATSRFLQLQKHLGVEPPLLVMLTLLGVFGYSIPVDPVRFRQTRHPIDRDMLSISEVLVESFQYDIDSVMRPIFDAVWNAAGWSGSINFDESGKWEDRATSPTHYRFT